MIPVWDPHPQLGEQRAPKPGVHNSGWLQSPGADALKDSSQYDLLEAYVKGVVGAFANDRRVLGWDIWNEPDNTNDSSYGKLEPANKIATRARAAAESIRMGPLRAPRSTSDQRGLDGRLVAR